MRVCSCDIVISSSVLLVNKGAHELRRHYALCLTKGRIIPNDALGDKVVELRGVRIVSQGSLN